MEDRMKNAIILLPGISSGTSSFSGKDAEEIIEVLMDGRQCSLTFAEVKKFHKMRSAAAETPMFEDLTAEPIGNGR
jgi:hypothetical protein